jgi:hypothetical protein
MQVAAHTQVTVSLDSLEAARQLSEAATKAHRDIGVLAEMAPSTGFRGCIWKASPSIPAT